MDLQQLNQPPAGASDAAQPPQWQLRVSKRARNLRIQVFPSGGVEIVVPERTSQATIDRFVSEHRDWIARTQQSYLRQRAGEKLLPEEIELAAVGEAFTVQYFAAARPRVRENGDNLLVFVPEESPAYVWPALQGWLKRKARRHLSAATTRLSNETGLYPERLQVRLQQTRWGSCSPSGTVSLNAAVALRTPAELRYVIIHELCHLRHMNHSRRYWSLVERFEPDYRRIDRRLSAAWDSTPLWISKAI